MCEREKGRKKREKGEKMGEMSVCVCVGERERERERERELVEVNKEERLLRFYKNRE